MAEYRFSGAPAPILDFLIHAGTIRGKSDKTVDEYFLDLRTFFRFIIYDKKLCPQMIPFDEIDISIVDIDLIRAITISDIYNFFTFFTL